MSTYGPARDFTVGGHTFRWNCDYSLWQSAVPFATRSAAVPIVIHPGAIDELFPESYLPRLLENLRQSGEELCHRVAFEIRDLVTEGEFSAIEQELVPQRVELEYTTVDLATGRMGWCASISFNAERYLWAHEVVLYLDDQLRILNVGLEG